MQYHTLPNQWTIPDPTVPCHVPKWRGGTISYCTSPHHTRPYHVIPCRRVGRRRRPGKFTSFLTIWIFHSSAFFTLNQPLFCSSPFNHSLLLCFLSPHSQQCSTDVAGFVLTSHTIGTAHLPFKLKDISYIIMVTRRWIARVAYAIQFYSLKQFHKFVKFKLCIAGNCAFRAFRANLFDLLCLSRHVWSPTIGRVVLSPPESDNLQRHNKYWCKLTCIRFSFGNCHNHNI